MLNIKDPRPHKLATTLARETDETLTHAVITSLSECLDRLKHTKHQASDEDLLAFGQRCAQGLPNRPLKHDALLYDKRGPPR